MLLYHTGDSGTGIDSTDSEVPLHPSSHLHPAFSLVLLRAQKPKSPTA